MWGEKVFMQGRMTKKSCAKKRRKKDSCRVNYIVGLANLTRLNGTLAATSVLKFHFFGLGGIPTNLVSLQLGKRTFFPF